MLFTFPSRYSFTIGRQEYLALDGGPPGFPHERPSTWYSGTRPGVGFAFAYGAVTLYGWPFHATSASDPICNSLRAVQRSQTGPTTPRRQRLQPVTPPWFGLLRFRSPLLTECSLFLGVLRCFSSPGVLVPTYGFSRPCLGMTPGGFPHSEISGSNACSQLPGAFRRLPRPSSALGPKASTERP